MKAGILAARKQTVIEAIAAHAERLTGEKLDLVSGIKGNADHRHLFMLERIEAMLAGVGKPESSQETAVSGLVLDDILAVEGLSKTSQKVLMAYFKQLESEQEPGE